LWGTVAMRLANADGLQMDYRDYAAQIRDFFNESVKTAKRRRLSSATDENEMLRAINNFMEQAEEIEKSRREAVHDLEGTREGNDRHARAAARLRQINDALIMVERSLTDERGLRGRTWYTHQIYAPGTYTGYAAQPLPDFRQALDDRNGPNASEALKRIASAVNRAAETLKRARD